MRLGFTVERRAIAESEEILGVRPGLWTAPGGAQCGGRTGGTCLAVVAGGDVACAGEIWVTQGTITAISNKSGHYQPETHHLKQMLEHLSKYEHLDIASLTVKYIVDRRFHKIMNGLTFHES